jgi:carboxypeptidase T
MKRYLFLLLAVMLCWGAYARAEKYSEVKIFLDSRGLAGLAALGIPADEGQVKPGEFLITVLSQTDIGRVTKAGFRVEILQDNYVEFIGKRNAALVPRIREINEHKRELYGRSATTYTVPAGFSLGSMGGFYTWAEVQSELDSLTLKYPSLCSAKMQVSPTTTIEGRPVYYIRISKNPNLNENEPKILYDGLTHAREPIGMQQLFFFMNWLCENYDTDDQVKYLLDNAELDFIPVMNPDGYEYNRSQAPIGGGMWRKNRRNNGDGSYGVDLNRNWGYEWGFDDIGSSPITSDETYRGTAAFSEPEDQAVRDFCISKNFLRALNDHSYAGLFLYPWSYIVANTVDSNIFVNHSIIMTRENQFTYGVPGAVLYTTNGDINDWLYGEQVAKPKAFSFTPEIGDNNDGFWPLPDNIIPLCQQSVYMDLLQGLLALRYTEAVDGSPVIIPDQQGHFRFSVERYGLDGAGTYTVSIEPLGSAISTVGAPKVFQNMSLFEVRQDSIEYTLDPSLAYGSRIRFLLQVNNGFYTHSDTITKYYGTPLVIMADSCNSMTNWTSTKWNVSHTKYFSAPGSLTDSPSGNYSNNENNSISLTNSLSLLNSPVAVINFQATWATEKGFDYAEFKTSPDGNNWTPMKGKYTHPGISTEDEGKPLYDGFNPSWVKEEVVYDAGAPALKFRFTLRSDSYTRYDGFYFDDFTVTVIDPVEGVNNRNGAPGSFLSSPVPNPANDRVTFTYSLPSAGKARLLIQDSQGKLVREYALDPASHQVTFSVNGLTAGVYFCRVKGESGLSEVKKLIVL